MQGHCTFETTMAEAMERPEERARQGRAPGGSRAEGRAPRKSARVSKRSGDGRPVIDRTPAHGSRCCFELAIIDGGMPCVKENRAQGRSSRPGSIQVQVSMRTKGTKRSPSIIEEIGFRPSLSRAERLAHWFRMLLL